MSQAGASGAGDPVSAHAARLVKRRLVLLGPPASGKGTQAELLVARYGLPVASPGTILREEKRRGTALGEEAHRLTSQGNFVPDSIILGLMESWLTGHPQAFVFDGFPRTLSQADGLFTMLERHGTDLQCALALDAPLEVLHARVAGRLFCPGCSQIFAVGLHVQDSAGACPKCASELTRRSDDTAEILERRLLEYHEKTEPLLAYYEERGLLHRITSAGSPEQVFAEISTLLEAA